MLKTIGNVYGKLRRQNKKDYLLLFFCCFLSVLLIGAYGLVMQSHTVQDVLPEGGDSRRQLFFIFFLTIVGCVIFVNYAAGLFFRFKSRECGIFLALGAKRTQVQKLLYTDISIIAALSCALGLLLSTPLALGIWKLFQIFLVNTEEMKFSINPLGYLWGVLFCVLTILVLVISGRAFIRRTDILNVINEQRKSEPIRDVRSWYGWGGLLLMFIGGFGGYMMPSLFIDLFDRMPPVWTNAIYLLLPVGLYLFLIYSVIRGWSRRHPYRHIISKSIMKFQGRQTVRNMCIVALLSAGGLFAMFYTPTVISGSLVQTNSQPYDCSYHYRADEDMITRADTEALAEEYHQEIQDYLEVPVSTLVSDGTNDILNDDNTFRHEYNELNNECSVISASSYEALTDTPIQVEPGKYIYLGVEDNEISVNSEITVLTNISTMEQLPVTYQQMHIVNGIFAKYIVLNDADFAKISAGLAASWQETLVVFNLSDPENAYAFCKALQNDIIDHSSPECEVSYFYDRIIKERYESRGEPYFLESDPAELNCTYDRRDSMGFTTYWKYMPDFAIVSRTDMLQQTSVFLMTFVFIFLVCIMAVLVILYTRALTVGYANKQVYSDLKQLGANRRYLRASIRNQISKVLFLPTGIGTGAVFLLYILILYFNSNSFSTGEFVGMGVDLLLITVLGALLYVFYRMILKKLYRMLSI